MPWSWPLLSDLSVEEGQHATELTAAIHSSTTCLLGRSFRCQTMIAAFLKGNGWNNEGNLLPEGEQAGGTRGNWAQSQTDVGSPVPLCRSTLIRKSPFEYHLFPLFHPEEEEVVITE
jgi:hypothetical protein